MTDAHALYAPSSAAMIVQCPGSVKAQRACALPPDGDDQAAREGTASHWAGVELLEGRAVVVDQVAPNGVRLTDEIIDGAELYDSVVRQTLGVNFHHAMIERRLQADPRFHPNNWGTPDVYAWVGGQRSMTLHVFDYKFGHRFVSEYECWQLINYVRLIMSEAQIDGLQEQAVTVHMHVIQPRAYGRGGPHRTWTVRAHELRSYWNNLRNAFEEADKPEPKLQPGPACIDCAARHACETLQRGAYLAADLAGRGQPHMLLPHAVGTELVLLERMQSILNARIDGLKEQIKCSTVQVPGWSVTRGEGRERWSNIEQVAALGDMFGKALRKPALVTPSQARKLGMPDAAIAPFIERSAGELKVIRDDGSFVRRIFSIDNTVNNG